VKTVLIFGFEPFGGRKVNTSAAVVRAIGDVTIARHSVVGVVLPCVFGTATSTLIRRIRRVKPAIVIGLGEASGRPVITPERIAINVDDARIADNAGVRPLDRAIAAGGPAAYFSTLPVKAMVRAMRRRGAPAQVSETAGTFVCNHVFYGLMHYAARHHFRIRAGFIHVPCLPASKRARRRPTIDSTADAIRTAIRTAITARPESRRAGRRER
jgi:pyroglutamyl-peptidase